MKRVLITGGCGFIGTNLAAKLLKEGNFVIALDNLYCADKENAELFTDNPNYLFVNRDVRVPFDDIVADEIYHLVAPASPAVYMQDTVYTIETIVNGTVNALNCARKNNSRLIIASTSEIYGESKIHPQSEEYNGNVKTMCLRACYDEAKRCAETYAYCYFKQYGTNVSIARLFNTYGPYMRLKDGRVVTSFIESYLNNEALHINGNGKQTRSFCYIDDLLKGLISYMKSSIVGEAINLGNDTEIDINTLAAIFMDVSGNKLKIEYGESIQNEPTIDHSSWCVNSIFRHVSKQNIRNLINKQIEIVLENEFLRWDEEFAKKTIVDLLATFNYDKGIPAHSEWKDDIEFENKAINALKSIICDTSNSEISNIIHTVENLIKESKNANDVKCTQIYERILYELNECSFKEFSALKALIKDIN